MLFDIRGRRKHVVRVVYAILALLMGASLFLVVGPFNIASLIGNGGSSTSAAKILQEQAERTEAKLRREPNNETLQVALIHQRIGAANALTEVSSETGATSITAEGIKELERGVDGWNAYVKQAKEPKATTAALVSNGYFTLAQSSGGNIEAIEENLDGAAKAQRIAVEAQPTVNSLTTLAIYEYFLGNFAGGDKATSEAEAQAGGKAEAKEIAKQMALYRKNGKAFQKQKKLAEKQESSASKESLENPLSGLSGGPSGPGG
jgi:hypothetical protein